MKTWVWSRVALGCACLATGLLSLSACSDPVDDAELYEWMERFCLEREWVLAEKYARMYTLRNPHDPAGHFYLGYRYLHSHRPWFGVALGEYQMALRLFEEQGRVSPIPRFESAEVFESLCHLEISKVYQKQLLFLVDAGAVRDAFPPLLDQWQASVDRVAEINPDSEDVRVYNQLIREFRDYIERMPARPDSPQIESFGA